MHFSTFLYHKHTQKKYYNNSIRRWCKQHTEWDVTWKMYAVYFPPPLRIHRYDTVVAIPAAHPLCVVVGVHVIIFYLWKVSRGRCGFHTKYCGCLKFTLSEWEIFWRSVVVREKENRGKKVTKNPNPPFSRIYY